MALAELGRGMSQAIEKISNAFTVDDEVVKECLDAIALSLLRADVQFNLVRDFQSNVMNLISNNMDSGFNKSRIIQQAIFDELCNMLDPKEHLFTPEKGDKTVILFVGLQGSGKTTSCAKYAQYHQEKGWKPALVCADTSSEFAFDHLMQNAFESRLPFYGGYMDSDPVKIAVEGVERFKKQSNCDLIIIDTSSHHEHVADLFEEMRRVSDATNPDLVIFVIDSSIGQAAFDQARAYKQSVGVGVGAVIITKLDRHANGFGALSAVTATNSPLIFVETGEDFDKFEVFDVISFVSRLLGMSDIFGLADKVQEGVTTNKVHEGFRNNQQWTYTLMSMHYQLERRPAYCKMYQQAHGRKPQALSPCLAYSVLLKDCDEGNLDEKLKSYLPILKSIIYELDDGKSKLKGVIGSDIFNPKFLNYSRVMQIVNRCGCQFREVLEVLEDYKCMAKFNDLTTHIMIDRIKSVGRLFSPR